MLITPKDRKYEVFEHLNHLFEASEHVDLKQCSSCKELAITPFHTKCVPCAGVFWKDEKHVEEILQLLKKELIKQGVSEEESPRSFITEWNKWFTQLRDHGAFQGVVDFYRV